MKIFFEKALSLHIMGCVRKDAKTFFMAINQL